MNDEQYYELRERLVKVESTVAWMKWAWMSLGGATAVAIVTAVAGAIAG